MPAILLAVALAAPDAPAPLPRPAPPLTRAELAGHYSATWCGHPVAFRLTADGHFAGWYDGEFWYGTYTLRGRVVCVTEWKAARPGLAAVVWRFRPVRGPGRGVRRHGYACLPGPGPAGDGR